jgi:hypothetical protein
LSDSIPVDSIEERMSFHLFHIQTSVLRGDEPKRSSSMITSDQIDGRDEPSYEILSLAAEINVIWE